MVPRCDSVISTTIIITETITIPNTITGSLARGSIAISGVTRTEDDGSAGLVQTAPENVEFPSSQQTNTSPSARVWSVQIGDRVA